MHPHFGPTLPPPSFSLPSVASEVSKRLYFVWRSSESGWPVGYFRCWRKPSPSVITSKTRGSFEVSFAAKVGPEERTALGERLQRTSLTSAILWTGASSVDISTPGNPELLSRAITDLRPIDGQANRLIRGVETGSC